MSILANKKWLKNAEFGLSDKDFLYYADFLYGRIEKRLMKIIKEQQKQIKELENANT